MLTALGTKHYKVRGLKLSADDCVAKPFSPVELIARVRAALRRYGHPLTEDCTVRIDNRLVIDRAGCRAVMDGRKVEPSPTEYRILDCFLDSQDRVLTHQSLLTQASGWKSADESNCLKVYIHHPKRGSEEICRSPTTSSVSVGQAVATKHGRGTEKWGNGDNRLSTQRR
jgi:DNA-binding response OmpR family regulator